jgi:DNA-binding transcriptional LysR family regulator
MEIKTIEAFLVLANQLNFTRSAELLYISQPAFSRQITKLEHEIGCQLFERDKKKVALTEYGASFLTYAQSIYAEYSKWNQQMQQIQQRKTGNLRIGFLKYLPHPFFPKAIRAFSEAYDYINLFYKECNMTDVITMVSNDDIDVGLTMWPEDHNDFEEIDYLELDAVRLCAALPGTHPLAESEQINLKDLKDEHFVLDMPKGYGSGLQHTLLLCKAHGFEPQHVTYASSVPSLLILVSCGVGVSVVAEPASHLSPEGVKFVPLDSGVKMDKLILLWRKNAVNPATLQFADICRNLF